MSRKITSLDLFCRGYPFCLGFGPSTQTKNLKSLATPVPPPPNLTVLPPKERTRYQKGYAAMPYFWRWWPWRVHVNSYDDLCLVEMDASFDRKNTSFTGPIPLGTQASYFSLQN